MENPLHKFTKDKNEPGIHIGDPDNKKRIKFSFWYFLIIITLIILINNFMIEKHRTVMKVDYNDFKTMVSEDVIKRVEITDTKYLGYSITRAEAVSIIKNEEKMGNLKIYETYRLDDPSFIPLLDQHGVEYFAAAPEKPGLFSILLSYLFPLVIFLLFWKFALSRLSGGGRGVLSLGQNKATIVADTDCSTTFDDVAGVDEAKQELLEVVDFLKNPTRYTDMGARIPKGLLLVGPPGTGKTLLARAVAGEAKVPFFRMSGSDFVEMFVGVGAARVRDLFKEAREHSPCIIFIDEIDAIGRSRSQAAISGNDEREQTLNQLLVEMDGFDSAGGVIILAATNRPEVLDAALLRPGRFDRQVLVDKPDREGRLRILKIHTRKMKVDESVDLDKIARICAGLSGADLANVANEAALLAVRAEREKIEQKDFEEAIEKSMAGLQRKSRVMNPEEQKRVAYHETGHALTAYMTKGAQPVSKISIIPRGIGALGYTLQYPTEDRFLLSESELIGNIDTLLGGRAAEQVVFNSISTGAANDISRASDLVRAMITEYGMSEKFKNITLPKTQNSLAGIAGREYSESTQRYIDEETAKLVNERYRVVKDNLERNRAALETITERLLADEEIDGQLFKKIADEMVKREENG